MRQPHQILAFPYKKEGEEIRYGVPFAIVQ